MPYHVDLDNRIRRIVAEWGPTSAKKMFGGVCHLLQGNMFCGVYKDFLILRLGVDRAEKALTFPAVRPFDITGRPMKGWVMVPVDAVADDRELEIWLAQARDFAAGLEKKH